MNFKNQEFEDSPTNETEFIHQRVPGKTYVSKTYQYKKTDPNGPDYKQPARVVYKVFDHDYETAFEFENEADIGKICKTPAGRVQTKAIVVRETGRVKQLIVYRCPAMGEGIASKIFDFRNEDAHAFVEYFKAIDLFPIENGTTSSFSNDSLRDLIVPSSRLAKRIYDQDGDKYREVIETDEFARDVIALASRKKAVDEFEKMLNNAEYFQSLVDHDSSKSQESVWQNFFEKNPWILGVSFASQIVTAWNDQKLEQVVRGRDIDSSGKRVDALMKTAGTIKSMVFIEIKKHTEELLTDASTAYRPGCWKASVELTGGIAQVQGTVSRAAESIGSRYTESTTDGFDSNEFTYMIKPRSLLLIGRLSEFTNDNGGHHRDKIRSFELFRRSLIDPDIVTYDELYERAKFIVGLGTCPQEI